MVDVGLTDVARGGGRGGRGGGVLGRAATFSPIAIIAIIATSRRRQPSPPPRREGLLFKLALFGVLVLAVLSPFIMIYLIAFLVLRMMGSSIADYF